MEVVIEMEPELLQVKPLLTRVPALTATRRVFTHPRERSIAHQSSKLAAAFPPTSWRGASAAVFQESAPRRLLPGNYLFKLSLFNISLIQVCPLRRAKSAEALIQDRESAGRKIKIHSETEKESGESLGRPRRIVKATEWGPDEDTRRSCRSKGKTEIGNLSRVIDRVNGVARCPYDPRHNSTAVVTSRGELYAATVIDFSGRDPVIYRSLGNMPPLRTAQYNSKWLNEPNFIAAYDIGLFTYFFLRENAVEHDCGKTVYSRVARVCKNDLGGRFLLEDTWTTFMKARLNCSRSGEIPFYYNELQSTFYLPEQDLLYGVFTTNV
ncbi:SEM5B protein, partial [Polyodon spathula]|nr:SEM5B protein [Polyodon spathula]